jgi:hypothetical protein
MSKALSVAEKAAEEFLIDLMIEKSMYMSEGVHA